MIICKFDCRTRKSCQVKVLNFSFIKNSVVSSSTSQLTEKAQTIGHRNMTLMIRKVFRAMFPLRNEESAFGRSYVYVDLRHKNIKYQQQYYRLTPLLMALKLVSSLVPGNIKLPIGKPETSFDCFLLFPTSPAPSQNSCRTQQCTSLDQFNGNAYLNGSQVVIKSQCTDPNAPITMGITFVLASPIFRHFLQLFHLLYHHPHHHHHYYYYYYYYYCFVISA